MGAAVVWGVMFVAPCDAIDSRNLPRFTPLAWIKRLRRRRPPLLGVDCGAGITAAEADCTVHGWRRYD